MMTKQKDEGGSIDGDDIMLMIEGLGIMHCTVLAMMMLVMTMLVVMMTRVGKPTRQGQSSYFHSDAKLVA